MGFVQLVHTLQYGDAISGEAVLLDRLASEQGKESKIFSLHAHELMSSFRRPFEELGSYLESQETQPLIVLHYSIGSPLNEFFRRYSGPRAIVYHNLTPAHWFYPYNPRVVEDLKSGLEELPELLSLAELVIADSEYNARELRDLDCKDPVVLPLAIDQRKWDISANPGILRALRGHGGTNLLHVGRLAPNKCIEDILKVFYFYHHKFNRKSKLWLVGIDIDTEIYSFGLRRMVREFRLKDAVEFVGSVHDTELKAFYKESDIYLCMSEHEGFCLPLLEAMSFDLPVVAYSATAVPETVGDGGILLTEKLPLETAALVHEILSSNKYRDELRLRGRERVEQFSESKFSSLAAERLFSRLRLGVENEL